MIKTNGNCIYAHSGGISAALNATACGVIATAQKSLKINDVLIPEFGLHGILNSKLFTTAHMSPEQLEKLYHTPSSIFGTSRFKLPDPELSLIHI